MSVLPSRFAFRLALFGAYNHSSTRHLVPFFFRNRNDNSQVTLMTKFRTFHVIDLDRRCPRPRLVITSWQFACHLHHDVHNRCCVVISVSSPLLGLATSFIFHVPLNSGVSSPTTRPYTDNNHTFFVVRSCYPFSILRP